MVLGRSRTYLTFAMLVWVLGESVDLAEIKSRVSEIRVVSREDAFRATELEHYLLVDFVDEASQWRGSVPMLASMAEAVLKARRLEFERFKES